MKLKKTSLLIIVLLLNTLISFAQKRDVNIVFIGNSITYGDGLPDRSTQAPPVNCGNYLRQQSNMGVVEISNQGHNGYTSLDWLPGTKAFINAEAVAKAFNNKEARLIFSIIIGTNDSAIKGPHGSPVSTDDYRTNLKAIIDQLLTDFPGCLVVIQHPIWYSPNTHNGALYLQEGLSRLQSYFPIMDALAKEYKKAYPKQVYIGDKKAFEYFEKNAETDFQHEQGKDGIFFLHPNPKGAKVLGEYWGKAIVKVLKDQ